MSAVSEIKQWLIDPEFEAVIGLEVHCQLATDSKIFCACRARLEKGKSVADEISNANTCPICAGHPGTLPVLNKKALEFAIRAGIATHCKINPASVFARKNYFYPDLPKGYQISQYDEPLCEGGYVSVADKKIALTRIHMEEDAGKSTHHASYSLVNLNRAGVPLIEIVSAPDIRSPQEASQYLKNLYTIVMYLEICDGNLQEGNFRCDANVSVRKKGAKDFGTRVEIKNINSFRFVERAIEHEANRQITLIQSGGRVVQETRLYDAQNDETVSMRSKEDAQDYRYFPDPDLIELKLSDAWVAQIKAALPELPDPKHARFISHYGLNDYDARSMTDDKSTSDFFEAALKLDSDAASLKARAKNLSNLLGSEVTRLLNESQTDLRDSKLSAQHLADLLKSLQKGEVSSSNAKIILQTVFENGQSVAEIISKKGLKQVSDLSALEPAILKVIADHPSQVEEVRGGKEKVLGFLVGQVMKQSGGKANPQMVQDLLRKKILGGS